MSHITHQSQRDENRALNECFAQRKTEWREVVYDEFTGATEWQEVDLGPRNGCNVEHLSAAQDICTKCGKKFTY